MDNYSHKYPDLIATKWLGHNVGDILRISYDSDWIISYGQVRNGMYDLLILTKQGFKYIELGDYVAKNAYGELAVFSGSQFERFYEKV